MARIAGVNVPSNKRLVIALSYIYGIGNKFSNDICSTTNIDKNKRVNQLTEDEIIKIRELDYFFTNSISRASKTMSECRQIKQDSKKTGTDN